MERIPESKQNVQKQKQKRKKRTKNEQDNQTEICYNEIKYIFRESDTFDGQLRALLSAIQLSETDLGTRYVPICSHLKRIFRPIFPKCKIYMFGSTRTNLGFKGSDLDICMDIGAPISNVKTERNVWTMEKVLKAMRKKMFREQSIFRNPICIPEAKVPIIKFHYIPTSVSCDISFKNGLGLGIYKTQLLSYCLTLDSRVRPLMMLIKYWAMHFKLTGNSRMPNFALILLVIFFLQQEPINIVPPIIELQRSCTPHIVDGWQVNFHGRRVVERKSTTSTIPELLHGFFSFYTMLDLKSIVICPIDGTIHPRIIFEETQNLPSSMNRYKEYIESTNGARKINVHGPHCCVQDPIDLSSNVTSRTNRNIIEKFVARCDLGTKICASAKASNYATLIPQLLTF